MGDHVGHGEGEVRVEGDDTDVPRRGGRAHDAELAPRQWGAAEGPLDLAQREGGQRGGVEHAGRAGRPVRQRHEVAGDEPREDAVVGRVPVGERIEHDGVDGDLVENGIDAATLTGAVPVEHDEAVLLPYEVEHREVGEHPPEREAPEAVEDDPGAEAEQRRDHVVGAPALELVGIEIGAVERRPHVGHVDADHEGEPAPRRQMLGPERGNEEHEQDRHHRRAHDQHAVEDGRVDAAAHQESRYAMRAGPVKNRARPVCVLDGSPHLTVVSQA